LFSKPYSCSKKEWLTRKYCSKSCANSVTALSNLGSKKYVFPIGHQPWNTGIRGKLHPQWNRIEKTCLKCGETFIVKNYRKNLAKYCSHECEDFARNKGKTPLYKKIRESIEYEDWRKSVFERDLYTCQDCGIIGGYLHAHHIKPFALYPDLRFEVANGLTLCKECHKKISIKGIKSFAVAAVEEV
jgi:5-methylcytosine-specific restriction endonuclease McrA